MVAELALTVVLLAGAGFMIRNFLNMYRLDLGIDTSKLLTMNLALPERKYPAVEQRLAFYERLEERLKSNPAHRERDGDQQHSDEGGFLRRLEIDGKPLDQGQQAPNVTMLTIDPRYFETIGLPLQRGRNITDEDGMTGRESDDHQPAVCGAALPQRRSDRPAHHAQHRPPGRRTAAGGIPMSLTATIVGIVPNVRQRDFQLPDPDPIAYLPFRTDPRGFMTLIVRSQGDPTR